MPKYIAYMFSRKSHELPHGVVPESENTELVGMGTYALRPVEAGDSWHGHSGALVGCTVMAVVSERENGLRQAYMQHYRGTDRDVGLSQFERHMETMCEDEIVSVRAGVLSPRNRSKNLVGPWVTPMSGAERQRVIDAINSVHANATAAFATYDIRRAQVLWDKPHFVRMDLVVPAQGHARISTLV
jgi:hypothetical protein